MDTSGGLSPDTSARDSVARLAQGALDGFPSVRFAVLFGSGAVGALRDDSDLDVAVYLESGGALEVESARESEDEARVQLALETATARNVDLLVLNRAPATVCSSAVLLGVPIAVRDGALYRRYFLAVTNVAASFLEAERDYREIRARSGSPSELDRSRLERIFDFLEEELADQATLAAISLDRYRRDRDARRSRTSPASPAGSHPWRLCAPSSPTSIWTCGSAAEGYAALGDLARAARSWLAGQAPPPTAR